MDVMFFINVLLWKKRVIIIGTAAGLSAALLFTFTKKNMYLPAATYSTGLFTSTKPGEGKSTIIEALTNIFSLTKKKVLLIGTNFSNNTLTEKVEAKPLLFQFNVNGEPRMEKLATVNSSTKIPNTDIIECRESLFSPDEVLMKNNLLENLPKISGRYDYILMEGAALNFHADTKELLNYADAFVAVFVPNLLSGRPAKMLSFS